MCCLVDFVVCCHHAVLIVVVVVAFLLLAVGCWLEALPHNRWWCEALPRVVAPVRGPASQRVVVQGSASSGGAGSRLCLTTGAGVRPCLTLLSVSWVVAFQFERDQEWCLSNFTVGV